MTATTTIGAVRDDNGTTAADVESQSESNEKPVATAGRPLDWDGPDDPDDPHNWPLAKRVLLLNSVGLLCLSVTFGTSAIVGGIPQIMRQYGVSETAAYLTVTLYLVGLALGPTLGAPLSELFGRRIVYVTTLPLAMCFAVGSALSPTFGGHLVCRFLCSLMGSPVLAVSAGTIADLFSVREQGLALAYFCATGAFLGPVLGPVAGGWVATRKDWKWTQWVYMMLGGAVMVLLLFIRESYKPVILARRARQRGVALPAKPPVKAALKMVAAITLTRPVRMLATDVIVSSLSVYSAFVFAVLLAFFEGLPYIFTTVYGFSIGDAGLVFVAIGVGVFVSLAVAFALDRIWYQPAATRAIAQGDVPRAELRLQCGFVGAVLLPVSLFWIGWSARPSVHWIVPTLGAVPFGCSLTLLFVRLCRDVPGRLLHASVRGVGAGGQQHAAVPGRVRVPAVHEADVREPRDRMGQLAAGIYCRRAHAAAVCDGSVRAGTAAARGQKRGVAVDEVNGCSRTMDCK